MSCWMYVGCTLDVRWMMLDVSSKLCWMSCWMCVGCVLDGCWRGGGRPDRHSGSDRGSSPGADTLAATGVQAPAPSRIRAQRLTTGWKAMYVLQRAIHERSLATYSILTLNKQACTLCTFILISTETKRTKTWFRCLTNKHSFQVVL